MFTRRCGGLGFVAVVVLLLLWGNPAGAAAILFQDNFEGVANLANPDNGASPGDWVNLNENSPDIIEVTDAVTPGAPEGSQYLRVRRDRSVFTAWLAAELATAAGPSNTDMLTTAMKIRSAASTAINIQTGNFTLLAFNGNTTNYSDGNAPLNSATNVLTFSLRGSNGDIPATGDVFWRSGSSTLSDTGINYVINTWQDMMVDIRFGTGVSGGDEFQLTIGAQTSNWFTFNGPTVDNSAQMPVTRLYLISAGSNHDAWFDQMLITMAIPEPASLALIGLGGLVMLHPRRQKA